MTQTQGQKKSSLLWLKYKIKACENLLKESPRGLEKESFKKIPQTRNYESVFAKLKDSTYKEFLKTYVK